MRRRLHSLLILSALVPGAAFAGGGNSLSLHLAPVPVLQANAFCRSDNANIVPHGPPQWQYAQRQNPPVTDAEDCNTNPQYNSFPLLWALTQRMDQVQTYTETLVPVDQDLWSMAATEAGSVKSKPNGLPALSCRLRFSFAPNNIGIITSESNVAYASGFPQNGGPYGWQDIATAAGVAAQDVVTYSTFAGETTALCSPTITANFSGSVMTVSSISSSGYLAVGDVIGGPGLPGNLSISSFGSATDAYTTSCSHCRGTTGTYNLSANAGTISSETVTKTFQGFQTAPVDTVVEPIGRLVDLPTAPKKGFADDDESADGRTCTQQSAAIQKESQIIVAANSAYTFDLYTNQFLNTSQTGFQNGFCAPGNSHGQPSNLDTIASYVTSWYINPGGTNMVSAWETMAGMFASTPNSKIGIVVAMTWPQSVSQTLYSFMTAASPHYVGAMIFLHGTAAGGNCSTAPVYVQNAEAWSGINKGC